MNPVSFLNFGQIAGPDAAGVAPFIPRNINIPSVELDLNSLGIEGGRMPEPLTTEKTQGPSPVRESGEDFSNLLKKLVQDVSTKQAEAGQAMQGVLAGEEIPLHQAVIAAEEAGLSFELMVEVRNKLLESYQELMRMQV